MSTHLPSNYCFILTGLAVNLYLILQSYIGFWTNRDLLRHISRNTDCNFVCVSMIMNRYIVCPGTAQKQKRNEN